MKARELLLRQPSSDTLFVCNHSGGKDSQAMFKWLYDHVPHEQLIVVHAHLPEVEWEGTIEHIEKTCLDIPVFVVLANKTFFEMVSKRGMWPSPQYRQCTSDLKTNPISKFIRDYCKKHHYSRVYNCIGLRAQESSRRAQQTSVKLNKKLTCSFREVWNVLPIHDYSLTQVYESYHVGLNDLYQRQQLYKKGERLRALDNWPFIWTYVAGMSRHSCKICIMSSRNDLRCSLKIDPNNYQRYLEKEVEINHKFITPKSYMLSLTQIQKGSHLPQLQLALEA